jgi:Helicase conserved C-terminal domain/Type III restriction enzyme, res subunit
MQKMPQAFAVGTAVTVRGESWRIAQSERFERCALLSLHGIGASNQGEILRVLSPFDRLRARQGRQPLRVVGRHTCLRRAARIAAAAHPWRGLCSATQASIDLLPWQLEPALAVVAGATRVLLADAVGLGKTIQAGVILAELLARGLAERALVLTPAGLRAQWRQELHDRFRIDTVERDQASIARAMADLPLGANPWATSPVIVSSIDLVKRPEHLAAIEHVNFDVLIVDEAHHVTPGTDRGAVVARLASACVWTVLVTATPHSGDERAFAFLRSVGATTGDRLTVFRRFGSEVSRPLRRRARLCAVRTTAPEEQMLHAVASYARAIWHSRGTVDESARLVATVLARRAASSAAALVRTLERRRLLTSGASEPLQPALPWEEADDRDDVEPEALLRVPGLDDPTLEQREIVGLIALAAAMSGRVSSKATWLSRFLRRLREPVVIFSEYRDTVEDLARRFQGERVALLHGGLAPAARRSAIEAFVKGDVRILLATDAAGEGLNLQARCRTVINIELPWNPVRLEQRVGRVDRLGQRRTVHAVHLFHRNSIEEHVLARLHRRIVRASASGGGLSSIMGSTAVRAVAECALGGGAPPALSLSRLSSTSVTSADTETTRLATCRRLHALSRPPRLACRERDEWTALISPSRWAGKPVRSLLCVFEATVVDDQGRLTARYVYSLVATLDPPRHVTHETAREVFSEVERHDGIGAAALAVAEASIRDDASCAGEASTQYAARLASLRARALGAPGIVQPSLFDGRATRLASERAARRASRLAHLDGRMASAAALRRFHLAGLPVLVAVWPA